MALRNQLDGVVVQEVVPGSPAARAGLEGLRRAPGGEVFLGDAIVAVNGKRNGKRNHLESDASSADRLTTLSGARCMRDVELPSLATDPDEEVSR